MGETPGASALSEAEVALLRDALLLPPARRLALAEALWAFARATPNYRPKRPDQFSRSGEPPILPPSPDRRRLAEECAKLDTAAERALAEEGLGSDGAAWPEY